MIGADGAPERQAGAGRLAELVNEAVIETIDAIVAEGGVFEPAVFAKAHAIALGAAVAGLVNSGHVKDGHRGAFWRSLIALAEEVAASMIAARGDAGR